MPSEPDTEEVEDLALIEVSRWPDGGDAVNLRIKTLHGDGQAHAGFQAVRDDVIDDLEARLRRVIVHAGYIFEEVIAGLLYKRCCGTDVLTRDL